MILADTTPAQVRADTLRIDALRLRSRLDAMRERGAEGIAIGQVVATELVRGMETAAALLDPRGIGITACCDTCPAFRLGELRVGRAGFFGLDARCAAEGNRLMAPAWHPGDASPAWCPMRATR